MKKRLSPSLKMVIVTFSVDLTVLLVFSLFTLGCSSAAKEKVPVPQSPTASEEPIKIPDTPAGKAVRRHLTVMYALGPQAETDYEHSLDSLRARMVESVEVLTNAYRQADKIYYGGRWALVQTLSDIEGMEALGSLTSIANERLPKRDSLVDHELSPYNEESVLKVTAIKGIGKLAVDSDSALHMLTPFFQYEDPVIRFESLNALAEAIRQADESRKKILMQLLPKDYIFIADVSRIKPPGIANENPLLTPNGEGIGPAPKPH